ncbi:phosphate/phosphite/phosphonate ABC transporter substrate-binding protein [Endozoicomonas atrinae]|uniref:phosphate/phosphite/phosphonate ABC transporter substrate-binding protein n=1 Tax=Endozoicomonas atrinae TaxID=1333660 RepID=UPI0009F55658|nr:phosphate/phosphite/phosphonate ABC transporter substrate-binding protein [Endozoicomonas atrinae]
MEKIRFIGTGCILSCLFLSFSAMAESQRVYLFGVVPQFAVQQTVETWQPVLDELEIISGLQFQFHPSPSIPEFEKQFQEGKFDFAYMNPYHAIVASHEQGYIPLIRDLSRQLYGILVVRNDSSLQSVEELAGKTVAFPSPNALGAALIPRAEFSRTYRIQVNELYVKSHSSVYLNVLLGKASAGGGVQRTLSLQPRRIRDQLRVLYKTPRVASHPVVSHPRVTDTVKEQFRSAFIELADSKKGRGLLERIPMKVPGSTSLNDYAPIRSMGLEEFYVR